MNENNPLRKDHRISLKIEDLPSGQRIVRAEADLNGTEMVTVTEPLRLATKRGPAGMLGEVLVTLGERLMEADDAEGEHEE